jgi:His-Xaa-Ser system radical SAM maturase HxsB
MNHHGMSRFGDKFLLTTECGGWAFLDKKGYNLLLRYELPDNVFKMLEEKCIILTENNTEKLMKLQRDRLSFLFQGASLHIITPTLRCNQKCIYCHSSAASSSDVSKDMDVETAKKTLEFIFQTPSQAITIEFQGGDTLMNFEVFKFIVKTAKEMNKKHQKKIRFSIVTNMTLMTDEYMEWLVKENVDICTSLDGPKKVHDANRKYETGAGTYDDVVKWIRLAKEKYDKKVSALMVTTRHSLPYWKEIIDEYVRLGFENIQIKEMNKLGFAENVWREIGYTSEEFMDFWKKSVDYIFELNRKGIRIRERYVKLVLQKIMTTRDPSFLDFRSPCGAGIGQLAYDHKGDIYSCDEARGKDLFRLGNVFDDDYAKVMKNTKTKNLVSASINSDFICDACVYKPFCGLCPVMNYQETNNIISRNNKECKLFKMKFDYVFSKLANADQKEDEFICSMIN